MGEKLRPWPAVHHGAVGQESGGMKVGMIFECGPDGADRKVCEHLARLLQPGLEIVGVTLGDKKQLLAGCGGAALGLLYEGCERIVIVWDLYPPWRPKKQ